jgi:hypothetical protein
MHLFILGADGLMVLVISQTTEEGTLVDLKSGLLSCSKKVWIALST